MELDLCVAAEIADQVNEATDTSKKGNANAAVARRNQRREARGATISDDEAVKLLKDGGFMQ